MIRVSLTLLFVLATIAGVAVLAALAATVHPWMAPATVLGAGALIWASI